jgi:hypothetical protein
LAIKFLEIDSVCSKSCSNELLEKAALWDTFCFLNTPDYQWLLPFFWSKETKEPSAFAYALAEINKLGGPMALSSALCSQAMDIVAEAQKDFLEVGGHPIGEKEFFVLLRLANGVAYEDVLHDQKEIETDIFHEDTRYVSDEDRKRIVERAKQRVKRAKNRLTKMQINVRRLIPQSKAFRKLLRAAEQEFNDAAR